MATAIDLRALVDSGGKISGIENYLINALQSFDPDQGDFGFCNNYHRVDLPKFGKLPIKFSRIPNKIFNSTVSFFNFPKFETLYGKFEWLWLVDVRPFAIRKNTKLALTVHDLSAYARPEFYSLKRKLWHRLINYRKAVGRADVIFAVSEYTKQDLVRTLGVDPKKIKVIYPGIDHKSFNTNLDSSTSLNIRSKYALPEKYVLSISTIEPRKNIEGLISAFEQVEDESMNLVVAGRLGWLYDQVLARINKSSKKDRIKLLGYVQEQDKPYLIANARMVCYPSFYEGFGFVPLEAMACGIPAITSARTSMPEVCGDAALLIEPYSINDLASAITFLDQDLELRQKLIVRGLERVKEFTWEHTANQIKSYLR